MNRLLLTALFLAAAYCASAQHIQRETTVEETEDGRVETTVTTDKFKVETNYFFDNCFISVGVGTQYFLGDNEKFMRFRDRLTPAVDFSIGKWFSPGLGLQLSYSGYKIKGVYSPEYASYAGSNWMTDIPYTHTKSKYDGSGLNKQKADYFNIHAEGLVNFSNIFGGYKERFYSVTAYLGVGWMRSYNHPGKNVDDISFNGGLVNTFRLSNALNLNVTIRGAIVDDGFDGEISGVDYRNGYVKEGQNHEFDGMFGATVGLTYRFKYRGWDKARNIKTIHTNERQIARLRQEIEELRNRPPVVIVEKETQEAPVTFPYLVNFVIDKVKVVNRERVNLGFVAQMIKASPEKRFLLSGYADQYTGSVERNIWLAENRAKNVFKVLTEEFGVPAEQLVVGSHGGVDNMFYNDPQLSRSVVITEYEGE